MARENRFVHKNYCFSCRTLKKSKRIAVALEFMITTIFFVFLFKSVLISALKSESQNIQKNSFSLFIYNLFVCRGLFSE